MTRNIHTTTSTATLVDGPEVTDTLVNEAAIREPFTARAELASLGVTTSPLRLEQALEHLEAAQQASRRMLVQTV